MSGNEKEETWAKVARMVKEAMSTLKLVEASFNQVAKTEGKNFAKPPIIITDEDLRRFGILPPRSELE